jgi:NAD(P)-dependent dehydrogenase (short-subunit alcohol dehydrogenase family)
MNVSQTIDIPLGRPADQEIFVRGGTMGHMTRWTAAEIADQSGRVALVTGANSGLGFVTARELARNGARVVLGSRDEARGRAAIARLVADVPNADVELRLLNLASLASIREFSDGIHASYPALDLLVNNAGVMAIPRRETEDGFEMQFGTNHLGHFALTGLLLPLLINQRQARVVTVASTAHKPGSINFDDIMHERRYSKFKVYSDSKVANLLFAFELQRRLSAIDSPLISVAAHPGTARTNLLKPGTEGNPVLRAIETGFVRVTGQSEDQGALPQLYAAVGPDVRGGQYYGPSGFMEARGYPKLVRSNSASKDPETAARLWELSEDLTGVGYDPLRA